tara:strand:- start:1504 stop:2676 length:1173 start_codon:yes stop_codon:yes gene_type:complete
VFSFSNQIPTILVSFDGMRYDYLEKTSTPNFDTLIKSGVKAESLIPIFPSLTFPNHYTIATGTYAGRHHITGNQYFSKIFGEQYSMYNRKTVEDPKFYKGEPIWVTAEKQGVKTASYFWVGSEAAINGIHPSIYKKYDGKVPFETRVDSVISWLLLPKEIRPKLLMLYFSEPDKSGHIYGPDSKEVINAIKQSDLMLGRLITGLKTNKIIANVVVVSDHGMRKISKDRVIILDDYLPSISQLIVYGEGPLMQLDSPTIDISKYLNNIPNLSVYRKEEIPQRYNFSNQNTGDYLVVADPGWLLFTEELFNKTTMLNIHGMHGWDPLDKKMHGFFIANGPSIKKNTTINSFENIYINGLISKLIGITPYSSEFYDDGAIINPEIINSILLSK